MPDSVIAEIERIQRLSVGELQVEWTRLYDGEPCRSRNRAFLVKRLCWRAQEIRLGGLSEAARARIVELAPTAFVRGRVPNGFQVPASAPAPVKTPPVRDPRLPSPGTVITRRWHGRELRLLVLEEGYELEGIRHGSLTAAARAVTGSRWNGRLFWAVTPRRRRS